MTHRKQHGGWASQATRRTEQYVACNTCGGRSHVRHSLEIEPYRFRFVDVAKFVIAIPIIYLVAIVWFGGLIR